VLQRTFAGSSVLHHPAAKFLNCLQIEIERLGAYSVSVVPQFCKVSLHLACSNVRPVDKLAVRYDSLCPRYNQFGVLAGVTLRKKELLKVSKVFRQGFSAGRSLRVNQSYVCKPLSQLRWYVLKPAGQRRVQWLATGRPPEPHKPLDLSAKCFRCRLISETRETSHLLQVVSQFDIPFFSLNGLAAFVSIRRSENSHISPRLSLSFLACDCKPEVFQQCFDCFCLATAALQYAA
jgi:hypothetical protein